MRTRKEKIKPKNLFTDDNNSSEPTSLFPEEEISNKNPLQDSSISYRQKPPQINNLESLKQSHPYLLKLAEHLQGTPGLQEAGNAAGKFNQFIEQTGLPSAAKGFLGTGIEMGRGLTNLVSDKPIPQHQYPELAVHPRFGQGMEILGSFGMAKPAIGAYQGAKAGLEALPYVKKIPELLRNILAGSATGAALTADNRKLGAGLGGGAEVLGSAIPKIANYVKSFSPKHKLNELVENLLGHEREVAALQHAKDESSNLFKTTNPESLLRSAADKEKELAELQKFKENRIGQENQLPGMQTAPELEHHFNKVNEKISGHLGEGEPHSEQLAQHVVDAIEGKEITQAHPKTGLPRTVREGGLREEIGKKYDELENNLPDVSIPQTANMNEIDKELEKLVGSNSTISDEEKASLKDLLAKTHPSSQSKTVKGKAFFRAYRSLRKLEGKERSQAFGLSPKEHDEWIARANNTKNTYENMENIINEHFPKDTIKKLHEINHEYANKVAPLHENPVYQSLLKHGKYEGNLVKALSGTTPGNKILNNIVGSHPELSRLVIGKEFAHQPEKLLQPNKRLDKLVKNNPEISALMQEQRQLNKGLETAKERESLYKNLKNEPEMREEIKKQRSLADEIKTQLERTNLSSVARKKKEAELEHARKKSSHLLTKGIGVAIGASGLYKGINKLFE